MVRVWVGVGVTDPELLGGSCSLFCVVARIAFPGAYHLDRDTGFIQKKKSRSRLRHRIDTEEEIKIKIKRVVYVSLYIPRMDRRTQDQDQD